MSGVAPSVLLNVSKGWDVCGYGIANQRVASGTTYTPTERTKLEESAHVCVKLQFYAIYATHQ